MGNWISQALLSILLGHPLAYAETVTFGPEFEFQARYHDAASIACFVAPVAGLLSYDSEEDILTEATKNSLGLITLASGYVASNICGKMNHKLHLRFLAHRLAKKCANRGDCWVEKVITNRTYGDFGDQYVYRIRYNDGYWFQLNTDPSVIEVQAKAATPTESSRYSKRLQEDLFDEAKKQWLAVPSELSGGHINIGLLGEFDKNPLLFRNFIVDFINHYEISEGILNLDAKNAASPLTKKKIKTQLIEVLKKFDEKKITTTAELAAALHEGPFKDMGRQLSLSIRRIADERIPIGEKTVELRSVRAQKSAKEFEHLVHLFNGRITYLKSLNFPLPLYEGAISNDPKILVQRFQKYVEESNASWDELKKLIPTKLQERCSAFFGKL